MVLTMGDDLEQVFNLRWFYINYFIAFIWLLEIPEPDTHFISTYKVLIVIASRE
jgi:hypothetical protein